MFKFKKIVVLFITLTLILGVCLQVKATNSTLDLGNFLATDSNTTNEAAQNEVQNEVQSNESTNKTEGSVVQPDTNKTEGSSENNLPQTGVTEDITVMFFIVVCLISAIYAYKKIRDCKN